MSNCPDCRYCAPQDSGPTARRWPHPASWFDQPCVHCAHRLKAHDPGVPGVREADDFTAVPHFAEAAVGAPGRR